jgi:general secretion pathway protein D
MKTLSPWSLLLCLALATSPAWAQRRPPPGGTPTPPTGERQITPQPSGAATGDEGTPRPEGRTTPTCEEARRRARYGIYFDKVDIEKLVQTVSDATCKTFILPENVRGKISIIGPENGRVEVDSESFYAAFLAALDSNGLSVYPHGRFLKIVDKRSAKQNPIPTIVDANTPYTTNEQMVTKIFRIRYVEVEPLRGVLQQLVSKDGDTIPYPPDTVIVNDVGSNMHRLERIIAQLDTRAGSDEMRVIQVQFATAQDVANTVQKLFEGKARPGQRQGAFAPNVSPGAPPGEIGGMVGTDTTGGAATLSQIIPDERTNKLIIVASPSAFERILRIVREVDVPTEAGGRINVYPLENADAEELAGTLQSLAQGTANRPRTPGPVPPPGAPRPATTAAELFSGEVKISADKATNALVIVASQADYKNIIRVIEQLDIPRRQVFVEAVIMEVNLDRNSEFGINFHSGYQLSTDQGAVPGLFGTKYTKQGLPPSFSLANLANFGGFLAGLQGPVIPELRKLGIDIPAFGVVLHALQQSSDVNVLSTPHILTSDNEEAEITVGQNVPFQAGFSPGSLGTGLGGLLGGGAGGAAGVNPSIFQGLGGLGSAFAPITRQNVELKLTVKPQINESDFIRMVITEQTEEIASSDPVLGPTTSKRSAKTTVVAKDQETVVIGGIMQDRTIESVSKVPLLGDIPIVGHLFRDTTRRKTKTNLLLFLTPYIIKDQSDFRAIFERKMKERQQFVEQFYGQVPGYDVAVDFSRKPGPLSRMNQSVLREQQKAENGGPGVRGERIYRPGTPGGEGTPGLSTPPQGGQAPVPPAAGQAPASPQAPGPEPEVREVPLPAPGSEGSTPAPESPERLRIQPDTGTAE